MGRHVATLIASDNQPEGLSAPSQGNAQTTAQGDLVVGWGALPYFSEFGPSGQLLFNAQFPTGVNTYRAYLQPFPLQSGYGHGGSCTRPRQVRARPRVPARAQVLGQRLGVIRRAAGHPGPPRNCARRAPTVAAAPGRLCRPPLLGRHRPRMPFRQGDWCIGNTVVSKTATPGSIPGSPAWQIPRKRRESGFAERNLVRVSGWARSAWIRSNPLSYFRSLQRSPGGRGVRPFGVTGEGRSRASAATTTATGPRSPGQGFSRVCSPSTPWSHASFYSPPSSLCAATANP